MISLPCSYGSLHVLMVGENWCEMSQATSFSLKHDSNLERMRMLLIWTRIWWWAQVWSDWCRDMGFRVFWWINRIRWCPINLIIWMWVKVSNMGQLSLIIGSARKWGVCKGRPWISSHDRWGINLDPTLSKSNTIESVQTQSHDTYLRVDPLYLEIEHRCSYGCVYLY